MISALTYKKEERKTMHHNKIQRYIVSKKIKTALKRENLQEFLVENRIKTHIKDKLSSMLENKLNIDLRNLEKKDQIKESENMDKDLNNTE